MENADPCVILVPHFPHHLINVTNLMTMTVKVAAMEVEATRGTPATLTISFVFKFFLNLTFFQTFFYKKRDLYSMYIIVFLID